METVVPRKSDLSLFTQLPSFYPQTVENFVLFITVPRILKKIRQFTPGLLISVRTCGVLTDLSWVITG